MRVFAISGLGADKRIFDYLKLDFELIVIEWISPIKSEKIENYSKRLIEKYYISEEDCVLGVSFGGLIAVEISKLIVPRCTILISSVVKKSELRNIYSLAGKIGLIKFIPEIIFNPPRFIAKYLFGAKNKDLLFKILDDTDISFAKWAVGELVCWENKDNIKNYLKINGNKDKLIPINTQNSTIINKGEHFMIVDKSNEISQIINNWLTSKNFEKTLS